MTAKSRMWFSMFLLYLYHNYYKLSMSSLEGGALDLILRRNEMTDKKMYVIG